MNNPTPSAEIVEKWNKDFELSLLDDPYWRQEHFSKYGDGSYALPTVEHMWQGFLIARSTVVIPLPEKISLGFGTNRSFTYVEVEPLIEAIESQGYKTKRGE